MSERNFYDKAKHLSQIVVLGVDSSSALDPELIYEREIQGNYEETIEGKMLQELVEGIEQDEYYFQLLADRIGYQRANGIREALLSRIGYFEKTSREKYEERIRCEDQFEKQLEENDFYRNEPEGQNEIMTKLINNGDYWQEESQLFIRKLEEDLYESIEAFDQRTDNDLMMEISETVSKYRRRGIDISDTVAMEIGQIKEQIENEKMEEQIQQRRNEEIDNSASALVWSFCDEIGEKPSSLTGKVRDKFLGSEYSDLGYQYDSFGPEEVGVNVATLTLEPEKDGKRRRLLLSQQIIMQSQYGEEGILEGSQYRFYKNDQDPNVVDYVALTEDEGKRLEMRVPLLEQARIGAREEKKKDELLEKNSDMDFPEFFG